MPSTAAVILVGGNALRINGVDKSALTLGSKTCLEWTLDVFTEGVDKIALSVGPKDLYNHSKNYDVIYDWPSENDERGAAFAVLGSLAWAKKTGYSSIITTPVDTPLLPHTFPQLIRSEYDEVRPSVCKTSEGLQSLHAIWPTSCLDKIQNTILNDRVLKISSLHATLKSAEILIPKDEDFTFTNVNNEDGLRAAKHYIHDC